jgi:hypothetical protein
MLNSPALPAIRKERRLQSGVSMGFTVTDILIFCKQLSPGREIDGVANTGRRLDPA